jgi:SAM-dependent methyltransferase
MHFRIPLARLLIKLGRVIQSSAVVVMRPDDLVEWNRRFYSQMDEIQDWVNEKRIHSGLSDMEIALLNLTGASKGRLLLLGLGGGREAIPLVKMGYEVTGIDFIPEMVERAKANAKKHGATISTIVQEISRLELPENSFDLAWLSAAMYSCVPTRKRRLIMLGRIGKILKPGGCFVFGFLWRPQMDTSSRTVFFNKMLAWLSLGNLHYEKGDLLRFNQEFFHAFTSVKELQAEISEAGFEMIDIQANIEYEFAGAIARKPY